MGFVQSGQARQAVQMFGNVLSKGVALNYVTLICVIDACSQGVSLWINTMEDKFDVQPGEVHYACLVVSTLKS